MDSPPYVPTCYRTSTVPGAYADVDGPRKLFRNQPYGFRGLVRRRRVAVRIIGLPIHTAAGKISYIENGLTIVSCRKRCIVVVSIRNSFPDVIRYSPVRGAIPRNWGANDMCTHLDIEKAHHTDRNELSSFSAF